MIEGMSGGPLPPNGPARRSHATTRPPPAVPLRPAPPTDPLPPDDPARRSGGRCCGELDPSALSAGAVVRGLGDRLGRGWCGGGPPGKGGGRVAATALP